MKIVHLTVTQLAGGPHRLVAALNRYTSHDARLVSLARSRTFANDLVFAEEPDRCIEAILRADIVHLHNYLDLDSDDFSPLNFRKLRNRNVHIIRQFRSDPPTIAARMHRTINEVVQCSIPSIVIAQYPERYYPNAQVVRNNVPDVRSANAIDSQGAVRREDNYRDVLFTPSKPHSVIARRWGTKGKPETEAVMRKMRRVAGVRADSISGVQHQEVIREKSRSRIIIDDLVTGSYHVSGLEGLMLGRPTLAYLDQRTSFVLDRIAGTSQSPFVNVHLEDLLPALTPLVSDEELCEELGRSSRAWFEKYWSEEAIASEVAEVYARLVEDPTSIRRQEDLRIDGAVQRYFAVQVPDRIHWSRSRRLKKYSVRHRSLVALRRRRRRLVWQTRRIIYRGLLRTPVLRGMLPSVRRHERTPRGSGGV